MKAQFATIEALLSLFIATYALYACGHIISNSQQSLGLARGAISAKAAAYDLLVQILQNQSTRSCALSASSAMCMASYFAYYKEIYGVSDIGIIGAQGERANYSLAYCESVSNSIVCVGVS